MTGLRLAGLTAVAALSLTGCGRSEQTPADTSPSAGPASSLKLTSTAFADGQAIPADFTCDGTGQSPPLAWSAAPQATRSFALVVEDPDAPKGTFRHWGAYDIPATTHELAAGAAQNGASSFKQTKNDFGHGGYGPPCPPGHSGAHHYHFRLIALDVARLSGSPQDAKSLLDATKGHVLGSAELVGLYGS